MPRHERVIILNNKEKKAFLDYMQGRVTCREVAEEVVNLSHVGFKFVLLEYLRQCFQLGFINIDKEVFEPSEIDPKQILLKKLMNL